MDISEVRRKCLGDPFHLIHGGQCLYFLLFMCEMLYEWRVLSDNLPLHFAWFSLKGGKMYIPKVCIYRQENGIEINWKSFFFVARFPPGSCWSFSLVKTKKKKRSEPARKEACQRHVFLTEEVCGDDIFPVSKHFLWWPKPATSWTKWCIWYQLCV